MLLKTVCSLLVLAIVFDICHGVCCPWVLNQQVKCECEDGSLVSPWQCCSTGTCNIFCCNCGGPCKKKQPGPLRFKRHDHSITDDSILLTRKYFNQIDINGDMELSLEEAEAFLSSIKEGYEIKSEVPEWFEKMDLNADGMIQPQEFDQDLNNL